MRLERFPEYRSAVPEGSLAELSRLYFDVALSANRYAFSSLLELVKSDKILFGSDYPFASEAAMTGTVKGLGELGLSEEVIQAIRRENALHLLPSLAPRAPAPP
jgi:6-methylsalicylate decarboxylase